MFMWEKKGHRIKHWLCALDASKIVFKKDDTLKKEREKESKKLRQLLSLQILHFLSNIYHLPSMVENSNRDV